MRFDLPFCLLCYGDLALKRTVVIDLAASLIWLSPLFFPSTFPLFPLYPMILARCWRVREVREAGREREREREDSSSPPALHGRHEDDSCVRGEWCFLGRFFCLSLSPYCLKPSS